ncbi:Receptor-like protein EIX2 [Glycine soja]|uniref:Receptor-like protein EIX2 n=1 Tax=Glycine soja TaxID=3848 RepID=A0A445GJR7_GLYSO|nr:Receptor-like protein EIX2 [Glycine soja]
MLQPYEISIGLKEHSNPVTPKAYTPKSPSGPLPADSVLVSLLGFNWPAQSSHVKCIEKERQALLNFKQGLIDHSSMLSTWRDDDSNKDCCNWRGIECNNETGHVQILDLHGSNTHFLTGLIDLTSLIYLQNMEYLDLSSNYDSNKSKLPEHLGSFRSLRYLNLSYMNFDGEIPCEIGNLSKLEYLDLKVSSLRGPIPSQLGKLTCLRYLDLKGNYDLHGEIPYQIGNLSLLRYLDLGFTSLSKAIPFHVGNLPILHTLRLAGSFDLMVNDAKWLSSLSSLTNFGLDSMPNLGSSGHWQQMIAELIPNLRELRLVRCSLSDHDISSLFRSHSNLSTSLSILDLSDNMLTSSTFQLLFNYSHNLQELRLRGNNIDLSSPHYPNFPSLVVLDLAVNDLTSSIILGNFNFSSTIQELYLEECSFTDKSFLVPSTFIKKSSSSLVTLDLSSNLLKSLTIFHWVSNFTTNLHTLSLDHNLLEGPIPDGFGKVMNSLEVLTLSSNKLQGEIPASLGNICTLQELDISSNNLSGKIYSFIQNSSILSSLRRLDLSDNKLTGEIPKSIRLLYQLESLHLEKNYLEGDINELHLTNLSKLMELDLTDNSLSLKFATSWIPSFQIFHLGLGSCKLGPSFPSWLQTQSQLSFLDISDAEIDDFVPDWFWNKLQSISELNMSSNSLKGTIPNLPIKLTDVDRFITLNSNQLEGEIPAFLSQAYMLDLSKNKISDLNLFLCGKGATTKIDTLDLSNNQIMGQLPDCWEHLISLAYLDLSDNKLSGKIPQSLGTLVNLGALALRNNSLTGKLPFTLKNCTSLYILDVGENLLSGTIPSWIGKSLQQLEILSLRVNRFFGSVPVHLCYLMQIHLLDLSRNHLSGKIPTCLRNFTAMMERPVNRSEIVEGYYDSKVSLMWKGQEHVFFNPEYLLMSIDLSSNNLTGEIPTGFGYLLGLVSLNLSRNNLNGEIPDEIGNLNLLEFLDLSRNHFSGKIPSTLSKIDRLSVLDLSNNNLIGRIPRGRQLQTFDASTFGGNLGLCGEQLNKSCPGDETIAKPQGLAIDGEDDNSIFYGALYMSLGFGFFTGFWCLLGTILLWQPWRITYMRFLNRLTDYILVTMEVNMGKCYRWLTG